MLVNYKYCILNILRDFIVKTSNIMFMLRKEDNFDYIEIIVFGFSSSRARWQQLRESCRLRRTAEPCAKAPWFVNPPLTTSEKGRRFDVRIWGGGSLPAFRLREPVGSNFAKAAACGGQPNHALLGPWFVNPPLLSAKSRHHKFGAFCKGVEVRFPLFVFESRLAAASRKRPLRGSPNHALKRRGSVIHPFPPQKKDVVLTSVYGVEVRFPLFVFESEMAATSRKRPLRGSPNHALKRRGSVIHPFPAQKVGTINLVPFVRGWRFASRFSSSRVS